MSIAQLPQPPHVYHLQAVAQMPLTQTISSCKVGREQELTAAALAPCATDTQHKCWHFFSPNRHRNSMLLGSKHAATWAARYMHAAHSFKPVQTKERRTKNNMNLHRSLL
jgi:hypothetical protein